MQIKSVDKNKDIHVIKGDTACFVIIKRVDYKQEDCVCLEYQAAHELADWIKDNIPKLDHYENLNNLVKEENDILNQAENIKKSRGLT